MIFSKSLIKRTGIYLVPDSTRVLIRPLIPGESEKVTRIIARVMALSSTQVRENLEQVMEEFAGRHLDIESILLDHYRLVKKYMMTDLEPSLDRKLLIGAYFTSEYALESAALFNPSIIPHPDQSGLKSGSLRVIMSLRSIGEGHISSITFRSGVVDSQCAITLEDPSRFVTTPTPIISAQYDKVCFEQKLYEIGVLNEGSKDVLNSLSDFFTLEELHASIRYREQNSFRLVPDFEHTRNAMLWLADSNYEIQFPANLPLSQRIIFPVASSERNGLEDARFVLFTDEDTGRCTYYATYTAYDGKTMLPQLIETEDFFHFTVITLNGRAVQNKGLALFPRKLKGKYAMLSRQDGENMFIMYSSNIHFWHEAEIVMKPSYPWEFFQLGNCGSPIETEHGWLVLTHGVGPMRKYCLGAILLDLEDPSKIIGRLKEPLLKPQENEREGYVPNVVYTCGAIVHKGNLILPYAMADYATGIALVDMQELLCRLKKS